MLECSNRSESESIMLTVTILFLTSTRLRTTDVEYEYSEIIRGTRYLVFNPRPDGHDTNKAVSHHTSTCTSCVNFNSVVGGITPSGPAAA